MRSHGCTSISLRSLCLHREVPSVKPFIKMSPSTFLPHPRFYVFIINILQETARLSVCARHVQGSILGNFVAFWPTCVVLSRYVNSPVVTGCPFDWLPLRLVAPPRRDPRGLPSPRIFMVLGVMKSAFAPSPSPGHWRARRLDSADVDSSAWLASTRTFIAFVVPFMV